MSFQAQHLLGIRGLTREGITHILDTAEKHAKKNRQKNKKQDLLKGLTQINLFYENSTRTRTSFELAGKRLGADVINMSVASSSAKKGESLIDTAMTLHAMQPDFLVVRHEESGVPAMLARYMEGCAVINAGDGCHEHPTQALLDAMTMRCHFGKLDGLTVAICGDITHSRVARSNALLLTTMGATVRLIAPATLMPCAMEGNGVSLYHDFDQGIQDADVIMMLRLQHERMQGSYVPSEAEYFTRYGLDETRLATVKKDTMVMHPGPINRGVEITGNVAEDATRSLILNQVEMGVAVRMAILELLSHGG